MPDLTFKIVGVEPASRGLTPLLHFKVEVTNSPETEMIRAITLQAQIQIQSPQRNYLATEKEKLSELFGAPERWGQTLRNKLWAHASTNVGAFAGRTETVLPVQCTFDLNVIATKFFHGLEGGEIPLLFLFSGTIFYSESDGRLQAQQISWNKECVYRMPLSVWREMMEQHFPNSAWVNLRRDVFDELCRYKRRSGATSWDEAIQGLLGCAKEFASEPQLAFSHELKNGE